jgi:indolepyruvate ferredoxin oxidoreductase
VVTIGALLGMAGAPGRQGFERARPDRPGAEGRRGHHAHPHRRSPADIHAVRIAAGEADLVLGCDMVVVNDYWALSKIRAGRSSHVVLNTYEAMPGTFTTRPDMQFPAADIVKAVSTALGGAKLRCRSTPRRSPPR